jgi:hypothetical protein
MQRKQVLTVKTQFAIISVCYTLVAILGLLVVGGDVSVFSEARHEISYISERDDVADIWLLDSDTLAERRLTHLTCIDGRIGEYEWSPDGSAIAYVEVCPGRVELKLLQVDTGHNYLITDNAPYAIPSWHPNGTQIAFSSSTTPEQEGTIVIADVADFEHIVPETLDTGFDCFGECLNLIWSSDGQQLAFYGPPFSPELGVRGSRSYVSIYDRSINTLYEAGVYDISAYGLAWPHHGNFLAIASPSAGGAASFGLVGLGGNGEVSVYPRVFGADIDMPTDEAFGAGFYYPDFSLDDSLVAVVSPLPTSEYPPDPIGAIYLFDTQSLLGAERPKFTTLITPDQDCTMPRWSMDAIDEIIYICGIGANAEIWLSNLTNESMRQLTNNHFEETLPRWRPST